MNAFISRCSILTQTSFETWPDSRFSGRVELSRVGFFFTVHLFFRDVSVIVRTQTDFRLLLHAAEIIRRGESKAGNTSVITGYVPVSLVVGL